MRCRKQRPCPYFYFGNVWARNVVSSRKSRERSRAPLLLSLHMDRPFMCSSRFTTTSFVLSRKITPTNSVPSLPISSFVQLNISGFNLPLPLHFNLIVRALPRERLSSTLSSQMVPPRNSPYPTSRGATAAGRDVQEEEEAEQRAGLCSPAPELVLALVRRDMAGLTGGKGMFRVLIAIGGGFSFLGCERHLE
ncbi:hypothetical protein EI94DRAFT_1152122 [Lactarius quietus]|nr:hypothetical protein EI94DRAFT_1152122 [Lactarius quietus]